MKQDDTASVGRKLRREKTVRKSVIWADRIADNTITIGGISVIVAVLGILVFLVMETWPLFAGGKLLDSRRYEIADPPQAVSGAGMDEYRTMVYLLMPDGRMRLIHAPTGKQLGESVLIPNDSPITAVAESMDRRFLAVGFSDGYVRIASASFDARVIPGADLPPDLKPLDDRDQTNGLAVFRPIPGGQYRVVEFRGEIEDPIPASSSGAGIRALGFQASGEAERGVRALVTMDENQALSLHHVEVKMNLMTGKKRSEISTVSLPALPSGISVRFLLLSELADTLVAASDDGRVYRYNLQNVQEPVLAETARVLPDGVRLTSLDYLLGGQSLLVGGHDGSLGLYFPIQEPQMGTADKRVLVKAREFSDMGSPVARISPATRGKVFALSSETGHVMVYHATSQKNLLEFEPETPSRPVALILSPRMDGIFCLYEGGRVESREFSIPHPETSFQTLFQRVWYEGYPGPTYTWQSSAANDAFESKYSLIPLIFGTVKAAGYSLLFAVPIAILAAVYTSEFVHPRVRSILKPTMEIMASLPSVVLGFVAALVLAPVVETWIGAILLACILIPVFIGIASLIWQIVPVHIAARRGGLFRMLGSVVMIVTACGVAVFMGPGFESLCFGGDFRAWLNKDTGGAVPFLFLLMLPFGAAVTGLIFTRWFHHRLLGVYARIPLGRACFLDMAKWTALAGMTAAVSLTASVLLAWLGMDPRDGLVGTYVQRNTLVVGFAMGFAVIPIIYTIAEDALNAVPNHLRAASLGCGATSWQTTLYVVLPAAISGVFSAVMIGLGRAVGETMIVVMAAGNTPILDLNIFNGLRALSATIAVELPEAVKGGTLYRVLFLSGLVLFAMTFVINTVAEIVRIRFRKRAAQL
jgi:phosphate transport system permease protein